MWSHSESHTYHSSLFYHGHVSGLLHPCQYTLMSHWVSETHTALYNKQWLAMAWQVKTRHSTLTRCTYKRMHILSSAVLPDAKTATCIPQTLHQRKVAIEFSYSHGTPPTTKPTHIHKQCWYWDGQIRPTPPGLEDITAQLNHQKEPKTQASTNAQSSDIRSGSTIHYKVFS